MKPFADTLALELFGRTRTTAKRDAVCVACGKPAVNFSDDLSRREYQISGFCQKCQDFTFGEDAKGE